MKRFYFNDLHIYLFALSDLGCWLEFFCDDICLRQFFVWTGSRAKTSVSGLDQNRANAMSPGLFVPQQESNPLRANDGAGHFL